VSECAANAAPILTRETRARSGMTGRVDGTMQQLASSVLRMTPNWKGTGSYVVIALGSNVHIFVRPHRRGELGSPSTW